MKTIIELIELRKKELVRNNLFLWLSDESIDPRQRLSFAPAMLYYLMGFKDVLGNLVVASPSSIAEMQINSYCGEDAEHWRWYLDDLERLGYSLRSWGITIPEFCNEVWSPATLPNRETVFALIGYAQRFSSPLLKMVLIQVFEATGVVFIGHTRKAAAALGMDEQLLYFGRVHYEEEFGHSVQSRDLEQHQLSDSEREQAREAVETLFRCYHRLFDCWFEHRQRYGFVQSNVA